jgi:cell division protein FtsW
MILLLIFQAAFNIGVVTNCLPTKGLALPFLSYGGTNLVTALFAVGTLINIGMHIDVSDERLHTHLARDAVNTI